MADEPDPLVIDWCDRAAKLVQVEMALLTGEMITEARFGADMSRFGTASLEQVKRAKEEAIRNCQISRGERPKRTRYALAARARPY